jgi:hypothetical protein
VLGGILLLFRLKKKKARAAAGTAQTDMNTSYDGQANYEYSVVGVKQNTPPQYQNASEAQYSRMDSTGQSALSDSPAGNTNHAREL